VFANRRNRVQRSTPLSLLVIAGGRSRRMGQDKALIPAPLTNLPMILHIIDRLRPIGYQHVIVVANNEETLRIAEAAGAITQTDLYPDAGPLGGLAAGLALCPAWAAVVACDMPLVRADVFNRLVQLAF